MDASKLGTTIKEGKNQKTLLSAEEEDRITRTFNAHEAVEEFSVVLSYEEIKAKNYSFSAGQYFDVKLGHVEMTPKAFGAKMNEHQSRLTDLFERSNELEKSIRKQLGSLSYGG